MDLLLLPARLESTILAIRLYIFMFCGILFDCTLELFFSFRFVGTGSSDLHYSSRQCLGRRVEVVFGWSQRGEEPVGLVAVIAGPKGIDDRCA